MILPDEQLLFPVLNVLPAQVGKVNVTMGYPVKNTPVYTFLEAILELQRFTKEEGGEYYFYHKPVQELLSTVYLQSRHPDFVNEIMVHLNQTNTIYVPQHLLIRGGEFFGKVFMRFTPQILMEGFRQIIKDMGSQMEVQSMDYTYLVQCLKQLNRIQEVLHQEIKEEVSLEFFIRLFRQIFREIKLPFKGEPLEGLQIMGVLESRNLDFKRVIICNMNEGSFPPKSSMDSMVPFNLRKAFGMPVQEQNDAIYAYTFYRLLHRAEEVHMLYTTAGDMGQVGEKSRYIHQIHHEMIAPGNQEIEKAVHIPVQLSEVLPISIAKDHEVMQELDKYTDRVGGEVQVPFSPSAINTWLDCRLKFYFQYIASIEVPDEIQEEVDPAIFGNLVHLSMEILYQGFMKRNGRSKVEADDIEGLKKYVYPSIELAIRTQYKIEAHQALKLTGQLAIARDVLQKYLMAVLDKDKDSTPFEIISLEKGKKYKAQIPIQTASGPVSIALGGIIDRVDKVLGTIRLIDYKSGQANKHFDGIESLFDRENKSRNKAAMQTMFYGYLYQYN
ncbi:MAG: PD-(D/E)XK nuclease family protein, partial [Cyclobacteriaceae bacterium]